MALRRGSAAFCRHTGGLGNELGMNGIPGVTLIKFFSGFDCEIINHLNTRVRCLDTVSQLTNCVHGYALACVVLQYLISPNLWHFLLTSKAISAFSNV